MIYLDFFGLSLSYTTDGAIVILLAVIILLQIISLLMRVFDKR